MRVNPPWFKTASLHQSIPTPRRSSRITSAGPYAGKLQMSSIPPIATVSKTTRCCSSKQKTSLMAAFGGALSLACLISAIMTDMWTYTEEGISPPGLSRAIKKQNYDGSIAEHSSSAAVTSPGKMSHYFYLPLNTPEKQPYFVQYWNKKRGMVKCKIS